MSSKLNFKSHCVNGSAFCKEAQFSFRRDELSGTTIQANNKLREYPNDGTLNVFHARATDARLRDELVFRDDPHDLHNTARCSFIICSLSLFTRSGKSPQCSHTCPAVISVTVQYRVNEYVKS